MSSVKNVNNKITLLERKVKYGDNGGINVDGGLLTVNASNNRVGINLSTPSYTLDVSGNSRVSTASSGDFLILNNTNNDNTIVKNTQITFQDNNTSKAYVWYQSNIPSQPAMLRFGSGSGTTSWSITPLSSTGKLVDKLSYGYTTGSTTDLIGVNYNNTGTLGDNNIINLLNISNGGQKRMVLDLSGNLSLLAGTTTMTNGFVYIPAASGPPTGVPTSITGSVPMYADTLNNRFYLYIGGNWRYAALT